MSESRTQEQISKENKEWSDKYHASFECKLRRFFCWHKWEETHPKHSYNGYSEIMTNIIIKKCEKCGKVK